MYRYRLSDNEINQDLKSRNFKGITLYRNRWLYSDSELFSEPNLKRWIVTEIAESKDAFKVQDKAKEREMSIETVEQPKDLHENSHDEIIDMCYSLGFTKEEVEENTKEYLISLIEMDLTLEGD